MQKYGTKPLTNCLVLVLKTEDAGLLPGMNIVSKQGTIWRMINIMEYLVVFQK